MPAVRWSPLTPLQKRPMIAKCLGPALVGDGASFPALCAAGNPSPCKKAAPRGAALYAAAPLVPFNAGGQQEASAVRLLASHYPFNHARGSSLRTIPSRATLSLLPLVPPARPSRLPHCGRFPGRWPGGVSSSKEAPWTQRSMASSGPAGPEEAGWPGPAVPGTSGPGTAGRAIPESQNSIYRAQP